MADETFAGREVPQDESISINILVAANISAHPHQLPQSENETVDNQSLSELEIEKVDGAHSSRESASGTNISDCLYLHSPYGRKEKVEYLRKGRPLYEAARNGNWEVAEKIFIEYPAAKRAYITEGWETPLHISAIANQLTFVVELLKKLDKEDLAITNKRGNTALCLAAVGGNVDIAHAIIGKYIGVGERHEIGEHLEPAMIRGPEGILPVRMAAKLGNEAMVEELRERSSSSLLWTESEGAELMKDLVASDLYESAGKMNLQLAISDKEVLLLLATKHMAERSKRGRFKNLFSWGRKKAELLQVQALKLLDDILECAFKENDLNIANIVDTAPLLLFDAAKRGNFHLFKRLICYYPELVWKINQHATLAPKDKLDTVTGAAFQMQQAICWYKAVEKIVPAAYRNMRNCNGRTSADIFDEEHKKLLKEGEKWMKDTAKSCMVVAALTATVMFSSAFTVPGDYDNEGHPNLLNRASFDFLTVSQVIGMLSSSTSILMFLSILTSRFNKYAFQHSLPWKLMLGLVALFVSIASMLMAFCLAIHLTYGHAWLLWFLLLLACVPVMFICLKFRLLADIIRSTWVTSSMFKSTRLSDY
nr:PREDICTED: uncharacterized protein LOC108206924 isoform X2 [Daucus carota subsp. sativus]